MATSKGQRIGILIIAVVMLVGTLGSFAVMVLANRNSSIDQKRQEQLMAEYQAEVDAQANELSERYYDKLNQHASRVGAFDAASVTELKKEDLVVGSGAEIASDTPYSAYYIGWAPDGKIFDQSIDGDKLKAPLQGGNMIEGWNEGVIGMKIGGVRELTIPSAKAYGEAGNASIAPNTPLKFIVLAIEQPKTIEVPEELMQLYGS